MAFLLTRNWQLRHRSWPVLQHRTAGELDRSGRRSLEGWNSRRTLGCHSGRGYRATVQERESDVRRLIPEVNSSGTSLNNPLLCTSKVSMDNLLKLAIEAHGGVER